tara:strand:+ start:580 stop:804 length:225 start_codon:yes stop_codon:yes gene_type:complete
MYDKDLAVHETNMPIIKLGAKILFAEDKGKNPFDLVITKIDLEPKHTVATLAEKAEGDPVCYLHNTINYKGEGV